jgi:hypothetical protein
MFPSHRLAGGWLTLGFFSLRSINETKVSIRTVSLFERNFRTDGFRLHKYTDVNSYMGIQKYF